MGYMHSSELLRGRQKVFRKNHHSFSMKEFTREMVLKIYDMLKTTILTMALFELLRDARTAFINIFKIYDNAMCQESPKNFNTKPVRNRRGAYIYVLCKEFSEFSFNGRVPTFKEFLNHIFYVGKGMGNRCFKHLEIARDTMGGDDMEGEKAREIITSWTSGMGVYVISAFHSSTHMEGFNREASIIKCIGLNNLANKIHGHHNEGVLGWNDNKIHNYGFLALYILYIKTINEGLKCIRLDDIAYKRTKSLP